MNKYDVIEVLKNHKRNVAIYKSILNDNDINIGIKAQVITGMPFGGNAFNSPTEDAALKDIKDNHEVKELVKEINRVDIWLNYLNEEERFVVKQLYIEGRSYPVISNRWASSGNYYISSTTWKRKRKDAIRKIENIMNYS